MYVFTYCIRHKLSHICILLSILNGSQLKIVSQWRSTYQGASSALYYCFVIYDSRLFKLLFNKTAYRVDLFLSLVPESLFLGTYHTILNNLTKMNSPSDAQFHYQSYLFFATTLSQSSFLYTLWFLTYSHWFLLRFSSGLLQILTSNGNFTVKVIDSCEDPQVVFCTLCFFCKLCQVHNLLFS